MNDDRFRKQQTMQTKAKEFVVVGGWVVGCWWWWQGHSLTISRMVKMSSS